MQYNDIVHALSAELPEAVAELDALEAEWAPERPSVHDVLDELWVPLIERALARSDAEVVVRACDVLERLAASRDSEARAVAWEYSWRHLAGRTLPEPSKPHVGPLTRRLLEMGEAELAARRRVVLLRRFAVGFGVVVLAAWWWWAASGLS